MARTFFYSGSKKSVSVSVSLSEHELTLSLLGHLECFLLPLSMKVCCSDFIDGGRGYFYQESEGGGLDKKEKHFSFIAFE